MLAFSVGNGFPPCKRRRHDYHIIRLVFLPVIVQTRYMNRGICHFTRPATLGIDNGNVLMFSLAGQSRGCLYRLAHQF